MSAVIGPNRSTFIHTTVALTDSDPASPTLGKSKGWDEGQRGTPLQEAGLKKVIAVVVIALAVLVVRKPQTY